MGWRTGASQRHSLTVSCYEIQSNIKTEVDGTQRIGGKPEDMERIHEKRHIYHILNDMDLKLGLC